MNGLKSNKESGCKGRSVLLIVNEWSKVVRRVVRKCCCCNPSLGLATKVRAYKVMGQERSLRITSHVPKSVGECKGMNPYTPK